VKNQAAVLTAAGLAVATVFAGAAFALSSSSTEQPERNTVPVGQLVDEPVSSAPSSSVEPPAVVADPAPKDTPVTNPPAQQPAPQPVQQPASEPTNDNPTTTPPVATNPAGEVTAAPPAPTVRCRMDDSDPVNFPNGREICETVSPAP
jgi:outer membrane biosynthesis protein TonB